ncbi:MAG: ABC transporter permease [Oscillospiraceae bacterium]
MKQLGIVFRFEFMNYAKKKSFVGITLALMLVVAVVLSWPRISSALFAAGGDEAGGEGGAPASSVETIALLDTEDDSQDTADYYNAVLQAFGYHFQPVEGTEAELEAMVDAGTYASGVAVTGPLAYTRYVRNTNMYDSFTGIFGQQMLTRYRTETLSALGVPADEIAHVISAEVQVGTVTTASGKDGATNFLYTYILIMLLYFIIVMYGNMVSSNVANEKSTRAMELLITSARPSSLMFGKVLGAGLAGLSQFVLMLGTAFLFYHFNASYFVDNYLVQSIFGMPLSLMLYSFLFFILGFFIYAFMYAALSSLVSRMEDLSQAILPMTFVLIVAFMVVIFSISSGTVDNPAMVFCSYFPLTSPMAMFARVAMGNVAGWEVLISVVILVASTVAVGYLAAAIYRLGVLLYGNPPKPAEIIRMLRANRAARVKS